jgi:hypothetical protein
MSLQMTKAFSSDNYIPLFEPSLDISKIAKGKTAPLYVYRRVVNHKDITAWAKSQGFKTAIDGKELHVTVIYSKTPIDWFKLGENWWNTGNGEIKIGQGGPRAVQRLGDKGAAVLMFSSNDLSFRNLSARDEGATWDYDEYQAHITISYNAGDIELDDVEPYRGEIILGPEIFEEIEDDWELSIVEKVDCRVAKVDESLGLVFGWAIVTHVDGEEYYDWNLDTDKETGERKPVPEHVTQDAMLKASVPFAETRGANDMHEGDDNGTFPFIMPLTDDIAKAFGIKCKNRGLMVAFKPDKKEMLKQFQDGMRTGFSIQGHRVKISETQK